MRIPTAPGVKVTLIVQLAPDARPVPHVLVSAKSPVFAPLSVMPLRVSEFPRLVTLIAQAPLVVPTLRAVKMIDLGEKETEVVPEPLRFTV